MTKLYFEDIKTGDRFTGAAVTVERERLLAMAREFDNQPMHTDPEAAVLGSNAPEACKLRLEPPSPDPEMVSFAASLDQTESAGDGLGVFFAERVFLDCD